MLTLGASWLQIEQLLVVTTMLIRMARLIEKVFRPHQEKTDEIELHGVAHGYQFYTIGYLKTKCEGAHEIYKCR